MIHATVTLVAPPSRRGRFFEALRSMLGPTRVEPGCLRCHLCEDAERPGLFTLIEEWDRPADFVRRLRSEAYRQLLQLMELSPEPPGVRFHIVRTTVGMEAVLAARLQPGMDGSPLRPGGEGLEGWLQAASRRPSVRRVGRNGARRRKRRPKRGEEGRA